VIWPITYSAISMLDGFESTPTHYVRETWVSKDCLTRESLKVAPQKFEIYIANPKRVRDHLLPRKEYLRHLQTGAKEFNLSDSFQEMLSKVQTLWEEDESAISRLDGFESTSSHYVRETWESKDCLTSESLKVAPEKFEVWIANPKRVRNNLRPKGVSSPSPNWG